MSWKKDFFVFTALAFVSSALSYKIDVTTLNPYFEEETITELFTTTEPITTTETFTTNEDASTNNTIPDLGITVHSFLWWGPKKPVEGIKTGIYTVALTPESETRVLEGKKPFGIRQPLIVINVGKGQAEIFRVHRSFSGWKDIDDRQLISPGELKKFTFEHTYIESALNIRNPSNTRVILYASRWDADKGYSTIQAEYKEPTYTFDKIVLKVGKAVIIEGAKYIPEVGPALSKIIAAVWPEEQKKDPWEERLQMIKKMIDDVLFESIRDNLSRTMASYRSDIEDVLEKVNRSDIGHYYMQLVNNIKSYPEYFSCQESDNVQSCFPTLPIYTELINTNLAVYNWGIQYAQKLNLSEEDLADIIHGRKKMVDVAVDYIQHQYEQQIEYVYNTCLPDEFYNSITEVRRFVSLAGLEYVTHWKNMVDPNSKVDYNVMTYSAFHGISSPALYIQAVTKFGSEPLTPRLITSPSGEQRRNKLVVIQINYYAGGSEIRGITLTFEEGQPIQLGSPRNTVMSEPLKMADRFIEYLDVDFSSHIDCLKFHMSDGEDVTFGKCSGKGSNRFALDNHYIASLYVANDIPSIDGAIANIAVSYQQHPMDLS